MVELVGEQEIVRLVVVLAELALWVAQALVQVSIPTVAVLVLIVVVGEAVVLKRHKQLVKVAALVRLAILSSTLLRRAILMS